MQNLTKIKKEKTSILTYGTFTYQNENVSQIFNNKKSNRNKPKNIAQQLYIKLK
jgi:hypothetical protein